MTENVKINNESGFVLVASLLILLLLVVIGTSAVTTSTIEIQIAGNERVHKLAFYAAEAAKAYVEASPDLFDSSNIDPSHGVNFPDPDDATAVQQLGTTQSFSGDVVYDGPGSMEFMRGKGFSVAEGTGPTITPHVYRMTNTGNGPTNALSKIEAGFFRVGL